MSQSRLARVLEPEGMESAEEVAAYDAMDHVGVNARFVEDFLLTGAELTAVADLGTGTALIPIELFAANPDACITAVDLAPAMLAAADRNIARAEAAHAITTLLGDAKRTPLPDASQRAVISNSLVHHLREATPFLADAARLLAPGGVLFVRDLFRPEDDEAVARLSALHTERATPRQRALFEASLRAALTLDEIRASAAEAGLAGTTVEQTSDRHWTLVWRR